jgi:ABC-2 type transport system ATP-binding protein
MICSRVIIINDGRIVAEDTPEDLATRLERTSEFLIKVRGPQDEVRKRLQEIPGVIRVEEKGSDSGTAFAYLLEADKNIDLGREISLTIFKNNWSLLEMQKLKMDLEEIFLKLVTKEA